MKVQHIKFEILTERQSLFNCNLIGLQLIFVLNMFSIGQIVKENFHPFGDDRVDVTSRLSVPQVSL